MRLLVGFVTFLLLSGAVAGQDLAVKSGDGSWYTANARTSRVEKRSADLATLYWVRDTEPTEMGLPWWLLPTPVVPSEIRGLRATSDGGVAVLTSYYELQISSLQAWDSSGERRFKVQLPITQPRMVVDRDGDFLVAGGSLRLLRVNRLGVLEQERANVGVPITTLVGIEIGDDGRLFLAGSTRGGMTATPNAYQKERRGGLCLRGGKVPTYNPCESGWVGSFDPKTFAPSALTYLGGDDENWLTGLVIDRSGNPVVVGTANQRILEREPYPRTEGAVGPSSRGRVSSVMTLSRLSPDLDRLIDSTWLAGSDVARGVAVEVDETNRVIVTGTTNSPDFPATPGWTSICGPLGNGDLGVGLRLSRSLSHVEGVALFGEVLAPSLIDFDTRTICVFNSGSFSFRRENATGQLVTLIGGPFSELDTLEVRGVQSPILYRSESQINFVLPREAGTGSDLALALSGKIVRRMDISGTKPTWMYNLLEIGPSAGFQISSINARRPDGTLNERANRFLPGEEIRAYATGIDLNLPLKLLVSNDRSEFGAFKASYVPGSFDSVVEFRFENRGVIGLIIVNGGVESSSGFLWVDQ